MTLPDTTQPTVAEEQRMILMHKPTDGRVTGRVGDPRAEWTHEGTDFSNPSGNIYAAFDGVIKRMYWTTAGGWVIEMYHPTVQLTTKYMHLFSKSDHEADPSTLPWKVFEGQEVKAGTVIAEVGDSGNADGPHLHFAVTGRDGSVIDPVSTYFWTEDWNAETSPGSQEEPTPPEGETGPYEGPDVERPDGGGAEGTTIKEGYVPTGGKVITIDGEKYIRFTVTGRKPGVSFHVYARVDDYGKFLGGGVGEPTGSQTMQGVRKQVNQGTAMIVDLSTMLWETSDQHRSFQAWFERLLDEAVGFDPSIRNVDELFDLYVRYVFDQGMDEQQLANLITLTQWYTKQTGAAQEWAAMTQTQRNELREERANELMSVYRTAFGWVPEDGIDHPLLWRLSFEVASGKTTWGRAVDEIWEKARETPGSSAQTSVNQRPTGIENKMTELRDLSRRWGIRLSDQQLKHWATKIYDKNKSDEDFLQLLMGQAENLYGSLEKGTSNRGRLTETYDWAFPYIEDYADLMETSGGVERIFDPLIQEAISSGMALSEFRKQVRSRPEWRTTQNAREEFASVLGEVGARMGYV